MEMSSGNGGRREANSHKTMRQKLERMESSLNAIPPAMEEAVEGLEAHCTAGIKLASLLETVLQDSSLLLLAMRYKEACETLLDKTSRAALAMKGELVVPVKRLGPTVSRLRSHIDGHAKAATRHENALRQLEGVTLSSSTTSRSKMEQIETKFRSSAQEFAMEDQHLSLASTEFSQMRTELMGGCFLGYLEVVCRVLETASDLLAPLGSYKELRHDLRDSPASSVLKEATVSWLAATQVNQCLRSFGGLSRNDVQCMLYQHPDGLPDNIRSGLNSKVDHLLKMYSMELSKVETPHHVLTGGFHFNPKAIELALKDCCSELEAKGAGADHAYTLDAKAEQVMCDVPRTMYVIGDSEYGAATGEHAVTNVAEKKAAVKQLLKELFAMNSDLPLPDHVTSREELFESYSQHVLNESCTTVTNTTAKTAVQLVFGKANLVLVRPSPASEDCKPVKIHIRRHDSTLVITVSSSWWLVEDYAAFAVLQRSIDPSSCLGVVDAVYTIPLSLQNYCSRSPFPELPNVSVTYRQPPPPSPTPALSVSSSSASSSPPQSVIGSKEKDKHLSSLTILRDKFRKISVKTRGRLEGVVSPRNGPSLRTYVDVGTTGGERREERRDEERREENNRKSSSESEMSSDPPPSTSYGGGGGGGGGGRYSTSGGRSDSFGRGVRATYRTGLRRSGSDDTMSSQSTLVPPSSLLQSEDILGITDLISRPTLTQSRMRAHEKSRPHSYQVLHAAVGKRVKEEEEEEREDDQCTVEGSPSGQDISIASDMELERVYSLLSSNTSFHDYQPSRKSAFPPNKKVGFQGRHEDEYTEGDGRYKYHSRGRGGGGGGGGGRGGGGGGGGGGGYRSERESDQKERDASSSGSSGIDDHYNNQRSRSGSAASLHQEEGGGGGGGGGRRGGEERGGGDGGGGYHSNMSLDSGVGQGGGGDRLHSRENKDVPIVPHLSKGLGSLIHSEQTFDYPTIFDMDRPPVSSSSSGGSSPVLFSRTRSEENIRLPERSSSRSSTHSMPPGALHGSTSSLNDFDHTPGSRPRPSYDYSGHSSQEEYWDYNKPHPPPPHDHFSHHHYNYSGPPPPPPPPPNHGPPMNYDGNYSNRGDMVPSHHHHERHSRSMQRGRGHPDDFSPSPGPPMDRHHQPSPYWHGPHPPPHPTGYDPPPPPPHQGGPPPQMPHPSGGRHHPPPPPPSMHDSRFQSMQFRPITSPSPSPGPSPHPTPPPTPPPPHGPSRPPPPPHGGPPPPIPSPYHSPGPPPPRGPLHHPHPHPPPRGGDYHHSLPPPQMGPPHGHGGYRGPIPPREPNFGPPPRFGPPRSPGPPVSGPPPGRFPPPRPPSSWDHNWRPH